jgi:hypothetical protein
MVIEMCIVQKMIAEDALTFDRYKSTRELHVVRGDFTLRMTNALNYRTREYKKLVSKRATYLLKEINYGKYIIYTDIDISHSIKKYSTAEVALSATNPLQ